LAVEGYSTDSITDDEHRGLPTFAADQEDGNDDDEDGKSASDNASSDGGDVELFRTMTSVTKI
jgi:hypothetical protein